MITALEALSQRARKLGVRLDSPEALRKVEKHIALNFYGVEIGARGERVNAYVNEYRWVITCPACNAGINVTPGYREAACMECGRIHTVIFPKVSDITEAERILRARPMSNRNWYPDDVMIAGQRYARESINELRDENRILLEGQS